MTIQRLLTLLLSLLFVTGLAGCPVGDDDDSAATDDDDAVDDDDTVDDDDATVDDDDATADDDDSGDDDDATGDDDDSGDDDDATGDDDDSGDDDDATGDDDDSGDDDDATGDDDDSGDDDDATGDDDDSGDDDDATGDDDDSAVADAFVFATDAPTAYTRVDRAGMPAINTAVITSKDDYNADSPVDDATLVWATEITANVTGLHAALDDDLTAATLTPCAPADCVATAAPLIIPDTISWDTTGTAGFPNGRLLTDPVIDVTLALVLLDIAGGSHGVTDLVGLNPTANDVPFQSVFPYLAPPH